jgi:hypothetical protein
MSGQQEDIQIRAVMKGRDTKWVTHSRRIICMTVNEKTQRKI